MANVRYMDGMEYEINKKSDEIRICLTCRAPCAIRQNMPPQAFFGGLLLIGKGTLPETYIETGKLFF